MVRDILEEAGWDVVEAANRAEADAALARGGFEVVVLDLVLPDADGVEMVRAWRAAGARTPVLGLTGAESDTAFTEFVLAGAHDVLSKSALTAEGLLAAVDATGGPPGYPEEELPAAPLKPAPGDDEDAPPLDGPRRVLVVDDTKLVRARVRELLERDGWTVDEAEGAQEALERAEVGYDLVIVDYVLPDWDGVALVREMRERGVMAPVVALTAHGREEVAMEFLDWGASAVVSKDGLGDGRLERAARRALWVAR